VIGSREVKRKQVNKYTSKLVIGRLVKGECPNYDLRFTIYDLRFTIYDLRFAICGLRIADGERVDWPLGVGGDIIAPICGRGILPGLIGIQESDCVSRL